MCQPGGGGGTCGCQPQSTSPSPSSPPLQSPSPSSLANERARSVMFKRLRSMPQSESLGPSHGPPRAHTRSHLHVDLTGAATIAITTCTHATPVAQTPLLLQNLPIAIAVTVANMARILMGTLCRTCPSLTRFSHTTVFVAVAVAASATTAHFATGASWCTSGADAQRRQQMRPTMVRCAVHTEILDACAPTHMRTGTRASAHTPCAHQPVCVSIS